MKTHTCKEKQSVWVWEREWLGTRASVEALILWMLYPFIHSIHLKTTAIMKVMAGRILTVAAANVADVYCIPTPYRFWSSTGLHIHVYIFLIHTIID